MALARKHILMAAGAICALAAISARNHLTQPVVPVSPTQAVRILIAKRDLNVGTFVQATQDLDWAVPPETPAPPSPPPPADGSAPQAAAPPQNNYLFEGTIKMKDFNGAVVRRTLHAGDPVLQSVLMKPGEGGFMSAVLESGKRAISIAVNATSGNAGFVSPGDHVDLIVTHRAKTQGGGGGGEDVVVSETFTHDVRVVAIDQMLDNPDNKIILAKTVTVEVSPRQAEQVAVAAEMGKISLALRSLPGPEKAEEVKKTDANAEAKPEDEHTKELKDLYGEGAQPEAAPMPLVRDLDPSQLSGHKSALVPRVTVIRGDRSENIDFYQGRP